MSSAQTPVQADKPNTTLLIGMVQPEKEEVGNQETLKLKPLISAKNRAALAIITPRGLIMIASSPAAEPRDNNQKAEVVLISMPFAPLFRPSIGLGLLKASLKPFNISTRALYLTLQFAERIGTSFYNRIADGYPGTAHLVGEWIFSRSMFGEDNEDETGYIETVLRGRADQDKPREETNGVEDNSFDLNLFIQDARKLREEIESYLDECLFRVASHQPAVVGFTSLFQQQLASLSLAKRIKAHLPETFVIFGGANCEGVMGAELVRQFPFVDAVVSGEGDIIFPELVRRVLRKEPVSGLQGVYVHSDFASKSINGCYLNAKSVREMDALPVPDYDDFFAQLGTACLDQRFPTRLQFETSRGCWWGEINHCTFCGLNGANMVYRSKSANRALNELAYLTAKHPDCPVEVVDNILDMNYFRDFIPELAARKLGLELFYEVKSNLKKEQVRLLRDAGIGEIQPGIESLSSRVLELMRKGVTSLQNIQLLKWCKELGVKPYWNLIWGFPGEPPEEYAKMAVLIPLISHLPPPEAIGPIRLDRFSPNFRDASQLGFEDVSPYPAYQYIYPFPSESLANLAYYFTFRYREIQDPQQYTKSIREQVISWRAVFENSDLFYQDRGDFLVIFDLRPIARERVTVVIEPQRTLYIGCDRIQTVNGLRKLASEQLSQMLSAEEIAELLRPLAERGLVVNENNSYLSLAIPLVEYKPRKSLLEEFFHICPDF